ncbi:MAG: hypothetical protein GOV02_00990 [Candidatus Aenigmarchaeota archaeon]|nr:hypothetical protein [Candidatus Aenigmarchaeota archaeon]
MVSQAFKEPANLILILTAFILLVILLGMVFTMNLSETACDAVVDKVSPDFWVNMNQWLGDKAGLSFRPLKWICDLL